MEIKIGSVLKRELKKQKLTVKELSKEAGVPVSTLHEWMSGRSPRNIVQAKKVANHLGISLNRLLFDQAEEHEAISLESVIKDEIFSGVFEITLKRVKNK
jgi:transcriptional regulator with XRE-family HTH domain